MEVKSARRSLITSLPEGPRAASLSTNSRRDDSAVDADQVSISSSAQNKAAEEFGTQASVSRLGQAPLAPQRVEGPEKTSRSGESIQGFSLKSGTRAGIRASNSVPRESVRTEPSVKPPEQLNRLLTQAAQEQNQVDKTQQSQSTQDTENKEYQVDGIKAEEKVIRAYEYAAEMRSTGSTTQPNPIINPSTASLNGTEGMRARGVQATGSSVLGDPTATIRKMEEVKRSILSGGDSTPHEQAVALRANRIQSMARQEHVEQNREEFGNIIGIGADAAASVIEAARGQIPVQKPASETDSEFEAIEKSEKPGSTGSSDPEPTQTPLIPLLDSLGSYHKNVEALDEPSDSPLLKDVLA